jgi:tryptophan-rich sensory protein
MLNVTWSWLYFGLNRTGYAQLIMALWLAVVLLTIRAFHSIKPEAARLMIPVAVWLFFVMLLNFSQWYLNGGGWHTVF